MTKHIGNRKNINRSNNSLLIPDPNTRSFHLAASNFFRKKRFYLKSDLTKPN